jgi:hypothetical protein
MVRAVSEGFQGVSIAVQAATWGAASFTVKGHPGAGLKPAPGQPFISGVAPNRLGRFSQSLFICAHQVGGRGRYPDAGLHASGRGRYPDAGLYPGAAPPVGGRHGSLFASLRPDRDGVDYKNSGHNGGPVGGRANKDTSGQNCPSNGDFPDTTPATWGHTTVSV